MEQGEGMGMTKKKNEKPEGKKLDRFWIYMGLVIGAMMIGASLYNGMVYIADRNYEAALSPQERTDLAVQRAAEALAAQQQTEEDARKNAEAWNGFMTSLVLWLVDIKTILLLLVLMAYFQFWRGRY